MCIPMAHNGLQVFCDFENAIHVLPDFRFCLVYSKTSPPKKIKIMCSLFKGYAECTSRTHIFHSIEAELVLLKCLSNAGLTSRQLAESRRNILTAYLTSIQDDDDAHIREARFYTFPKGYFLGSTRNIKSIGQRLHVHVSDLTKLRSLLGYDLGRKLLIALGLMKCCQIGPLQHQHQP